MSLNIAVPLGFRAEPGDDDELVRRGPVDDLEYDESAFAGCVAA
ncbi:hypothetical protein [Nocardia sp. NPDC050412]|jgi:hypothetical protein